MDRVFQFPFVGGKKCIKADEIIYIETARHKNIFTLGTRHTAFIRSWTR